MQTSNLQSAGIPRASWKKTALHWCMAFFIPFAITFGLLVTHEKNRAYENLQRDRPMLGQETCQPGDELEAWKSGAIFTVILALPIGLIGLGGYGCFVLSKKLLRRSKPN